MKKFMSLFLAIVMVLGLVASMSGSYHIRSNRESGDGRFDLQLEPKTGQLPGIASLGMYLSSYFCPAKVTAVR